MNDTLRDEFDFILVMAEAQPEKSRHQVVSQCLELMRLAGRYNRICVKECNSGLTPRDITQRNNIGTKISELVGRTIGVKLGGDPRGATIKLILPTGEHNSWGGKEEGYCVPRS